MSKKINKFCLDIRDKDSINQSVDSPETSEIKKDKSQEDNNDADFDNLPLDRNQEEDAEIKQLQKTYKEKLKEIENLTNEIKLKDEEISSMNKKKNKLYNYDNNNENSNEDLNKNDLTEEELKNELFKLGKQYNDEVQRCTKLHDEKIKNMKEEIAQLKKQISNYNNKDEYISKEEHDRILNELKQKHEQELEPFRKELSEFQKFIDDNFPGVKK